MKNLPRGTMYGAIILVIVAVSNFNGLRTLGEKVNKDFPNYPMYH